MAKMLTVSIMDQFKSACKITLRIMIYLVSVVCCVYVYRLENNRHIFQELKNRMIGKKTHNYQGLKIRA